jgi:hypothetical protein
MRKKIAPPKKATKPASASKRAPKKRPARVKACEYYPPPACYVLEEHLEL